MKKLISAVLVVSVLIFCLSIFLLKSQYEREKEEREENIYSNGYGEGYLKGYKAGCDVGYDDGYDDGEDDGYYAGAAYAYLFFGDVDRAFQSANSANTTTAWRYFIDAYDQYISSIFEFDDVDDAIARYKLVSALTSVMISDDATEEEIELLVSTFGEDLFIRNGITLS